MYSTARSRIIRSERAARAKASMGSLMLFQTKKEELCKSFKREMYQWARRTTIGELLGLFDGRVLHELVKRLNCHVFEVFTVAEVR